MEITAIRKPSPEPYRKQQLDFFSFLFFLMRVAGGEGEEVEGGRSGGGDWRGSTHTKKPTLKENASKEGDSVIPTSSSKPSTGTLTPNPAD